MCRYALTTYKSHYACFACRRTFRRRLKRDVDPDGGDHPPSCPVCRGAVADLGLDFKSPPHQRVRAWAVVEALWAVGETFHSCGCGGPGYRPRTASAYRVFLAARLVEYEASLRAWRAEPIDHPGRAAAIATWTNRITALRAALRSA